MSEYWIGWIKQTSEDAVYAADGTRMLDYVQCTGGIVDRATQPRLWSELGGVGGELFVNNSFDDGIIPWLNQGGGVLSAEGGVMTYMRQGAEYAAHCYQAPYTYSSVEYLVTGTGIVGIVGNVSLRMERYLQVLPWSGEPVTFFGVNSPQSIGLSSSGMIANGHMQADSLSMTVSNVYIPTMVAPEGSTKPYKIIGDHVHSAIGRVVNSDSTKWQDTLGVDAYDLVTCDGTFPDASHPELAQYLRELNEYTHGDTLEVTVTASPFAICDDGAHLWCAGIDETRDTLYQLDHDGVATGFSIDMSATHVYKRTFGVTAVNDTLWAQQQQGSDVANVFFRYTKAGVYTGQSVTPTEDIELRALHWDGSHIWAVGVNKRIYQYDEDFVPTGFSIERVDGDAGYNSIGVIGDIIHLGGTLSQVYGYNKITGEYLGVMFSTAPKGCARGIAVANGVFTVVSSDTAEVDTYVIGKLPYYADPVAPNQPYKMMADLTEGLI